MAASYPGTIPNLTNPTGTDQMDNAAVRHSTQHANANDEIEAITTELGTDVAGNHADLKARLLSESATLRASTSLVLGMEGLKTITWTSATEARVKWTGELMVLGMGRGSHFATNGFFDIYMPTAGTVIQRIGTTGTTSVTVQADGIPLISRDVLYFVMDVGTNGSGNKFSNFRIADYTADFVVPDNWIRVVARVPSGAGTYADYVWNVDGGSVNQHWWSLTLNAPWAAYGSGYSDPAYRRDNGLVTVKGLIAGGSQGIIANLPAGFRPLQQKICLAACSAGVARVDVMPNGDIAHQGYQTSTGNTAWFSLENISFMAEQ